MANGIDVSSHQGAIDWPRTAAAIDFALIRCGFGNDQTDQDDSRFAENVAGCEAQNLPWGTYLYSYATNLDEAQSELEHILRLLEGRRPLYPVYLDMEDADGYKAARGVSNATCVAICQHVCSGLEAAGYYAGIYSNKDWLTNRLNDPVLDRFDKWLAQWAEEPTYTGQYGVWQYTSDATMAGVAGRVDADRTTGYRDYPAYIRAHGLNGWTGEDTPTPPPVTGEIQAGDVVHYAGRLYADSYGGGAGRTVDGNFTVERVIAGRAYGVLLPAGWAEAAACTVVETDAGETPAPVLRVGATVRYSGPLYADSYGGGRGQTVDGTYTVDIYMPGRPCAVHIPPGWVPEEACTVVG